MSALPAVLLGRILRVLVRLVRPGGGSALPGLVVSKVAPGLLAKTLNALPGGVVIITGAAGKSTTTKMVVSIARAHGLKVFTNPTTANILQGFYASIIQFGDWLGRVPGEIAILEMDEGHAAELVNQVSPKLVTVLNVVEDQLDRFVDPALVREKLAKVARASIGPVVLNTDDQNLLLINQQLPTGKSHWFGYRAGAVNLHYAPTYLPNLDSPEPLTSVVSQDGRRINLSVHGERISFEIPNRGAHFALDAAAAVETAYQLLGDRFDLNLTQQTLSELPPVFARGEVANVRGKDVEFILIQNPASTQLNLDNLPEDLERVFFAIGRDVHDPSWLWTVTPGRLRHVDVVSGFNCAEAQLWLMHNGIEPELATDDLAAAFDHWMTLPDPSHGVRTVIFSADAMRRTRRMLGLTDPEAVSR